MTEQQLFEKYNVDDSHNQWSGTDSWNSVEIFRLMHNGQLPGESDRKTKWVIDFLDKVDNDPQWWRSKVMSRKDWGSLFLTAKRMVRTLATHILAEVNEVKPWDYSPACGLTEAEWKERQKLLKRYRSKTSWFSPAQKKRLEELSAKMLQHSN